VFHRSVRFHTGIQAWAIAALMTLVTAASDVGAAVPNDDSSRAAAQLAALDVPFVSNLGQSDDAVAYYAQIRAGTAFVTHGGEIVYALCPAGEDPETREGWTLVETMVGGRARVSAGKASSTGVGIFTGNDPERWRSDVPAFETVCLGEVWPGVEVEVRAHGNSVEKLFTLSPDASADSIRLRIAGTTGLSLADDGSMIVGTGPGGAQASAPVAWQEVDGRRRMVDVAYRLDRDGSYGFALGDHDASLPIFIDPILQSTYLGGSGDDWILSMAATAAGDILVAGRTASTNFPGVSGGAQPVKSGSSDAFVALLNPGLTSIIRATYLGGSGSDVGHALAVSDRGIYLAGKTSSTNFPGAAVGGDGIFGGADEGFIAWFDHSLSMLHRSTFIGGSGSDIVYGIAAYRSTGNIVAVGKTTSSDLPESFLGAYSAYLGGPSDGFVAKFTSDLSLLLVSSYAGGENSDECRGVALNETSGSSYEYQVYVVGTTSSFNVPARGGFRATKAYSHEGFAARFSNSLGAWEQGTYLGGDSGNAILIRYAEGGGVYVAGGGAGVPGTAGGAQPVGSGYVERLDPSLRSLVRATCIGAGGNTVALSLAYQQGSDSIYAGGTIAADDLPGATSGAQPHHASANEAVRPDGFVVRLDTDLTTQQGATYLGGRYSEADCVVLYANDSVYIAGSTMSDDIPNTAAGAQPTHTAYEWQGFISRVSADLSGCTEPVITVQPLSQTVPPGTAVTLTVAAASGLPLSYQWYEGGPGDCSRPVGGNFPSFTTPPLQGDFVTYFVRVRNGCGFVDSGPALITMSGRCCPPWIVTQPMSRKIASGGSVTLSVVAGGTGPLSYQWFYRRAGTLLYVPVGTDSSSYTTTPQTTTAEYWVRVSNSCGTASSAVATLTIPVPPTIRSISGISARVGQSITIYVSGTTRDVGLLNVYFGDVRASVISRVTSTSIRVQVPAVRRGRLQVYLISEGMESNRRTYRIR